MATAQRIISHFKKPDTMYTPEQVLAKPSCVPKEPGFYGWYFRDLPKGVPRKGGVVANGMTLLYVGIAPSSSSSPANLRSRLRQHLRSNAAGSTLRLSIGCLLAERLNLELRRTRSGKRRTFGPGEQVLSVWLNDHAQQHAFHSALSTLRSTSKKRADTLPCL